MRLVLCGSDDFIYKVHHECRASPGVSTGEAAIKQEAADQPCTQAAATNVPAAAPSGQAAVYADAVEPARPQFRGSRAAFNAPLSYPRCSVNDAQHDNTVKQDLLWLPLMHLCAQSHDAVF